MLVVAIGLVVYFQVSTPLFLSTDNLRNIAQATAPTAIVAVGIVFLLVSGEIDISVGHGRGARAVPDALRDRLLRRAGRAGDPAGAG